MTSGLVLGASHLGLPVSTTHVSCSAIFGIGLAKRQGYWATIRRILATWLTTLPLALLLGLVFGYLLRTLDLRMGATALRKRLSAAPPPGGIG